MTQLASPYTTRRVFLERDVDYSTKAFKMTRDHHQCFDVATLFTGDRGMFTSAKIQKTSLRGLVFFFFFWRFSLREFVFSLRGLLLRLVEILLELLLGLLLRTLLEIDDALGDFGAEELGLVFWSAFSDLSRFCSPTDCGLGCGLGLRPNVLGDGEF